MCSVCCEKFHGFELSLARSESRIELVFFLKSCLELGHLVSVFQLPVSGVAPQISLHSHAIEHWSHNSIIMCL